MHGVGGGGAAVGGCIGGAPYKKMGVNLKKKKKNSMQEVVRGWDQEGPKGPPGGPKATSLRDGLKKNLTKLKH